MQMFREQRLGVKAIISSYPDKRWKLSILLRSLQSSRPH